MQRLKKLFRISNEYVLVRGQGYPTFRKNRANLTENAVRANKGTHEHRTMIQRKAAKSLLCRAQKVANRLMLLGAASLLAMPSLSPTELTTPGIVREFLAPIDDVRQAVISVQSDHIVHGTLVFDKEPTLTGAEAVKSTPLFDPWTGPGEVYYKIREKAIAPRHFLDTADMGTIAVRYVVIPVNPERTRVKIDAVYLEGAHNRVHASDGNVEKFEMNEVKDALDSLQEAAMEAADARRRALSAELVRQSYARQREEEAARVNNAQTSEKDLEQQIDALRRELERHVKAPGADLKGAPFQSAANLKTLPAHSEVVVLIVTPHWLGVETAEGQRGWLPVEQLEPLP